MADIDTMIRDAERRSDALFDLRPKAPVIAQPYPEYRWASAAASYTAPPLDGSRPGVYQMPLRRERLTKLGLRTLVYHETVPGHHFQVALSVENRGVPKFRQTGAFGGTSAFGEGWALYAERLAAEEGWYEGDPEGLLGQLDAELFRARRLVVDTGLHALRWTRQQAIDYGIEASEVERYVVMPGQATAYKIGQLEIIRLRDKARVRPRRPLRPPPVPQPGPAHRAPCPSPCWSGKWTPTSARRRQTEHEAARGANRQDAGRGGVVRQRGGLPGHGRTAPAPEHRLRPRGRPALGRSGLHGPSVREDAAHRPDRPRRARASRNAFATTPLCSPSRACFLTGLYAHTHGIIDNTDRSARSHKLVTFPRLLHDAGYETAFIGKWHMGVDDSPRPGLRPLGEREGAGRGYFDPELNVDGQRARRPRAT